MECRSSKAVWRNILGQEHCGPQETTAALGDCAIEIYQWNDKFSFANEFGANQGFLNQNR